MTGKRKRYSAEFKARVALETLCGELTTASAGQQARHSPDDGRKQAIEGLTSVFSDKLEAQETEKSSEPEVEKLHAKIRQLLVE